jgi:hypothetical protein
MGYALWSSLTFFHLKRSVITEEDADRVWGCVENAIHQMAEEEDDDELDDEYI